MSLHNGMVPYTSICLLSRPLRWESDNVCMQTITIYCVAMLFVISPFPCSLLLSPIGLGGLNYEWGSLLPEYCILQYHIQNIRNIDDVANH